jgi:hypothetical protein
MSIIKYKIFTSLTDRNYFSKIVEVDGAVYKTKEDQLDYVNELVTDEINSFDLTDWNEEGSECVDFSLDEVVKL